MTGCNAIMSCLKKVKAFDGDAQNYFPNMNKKLLNLETERTTGNL